MKEKRRVRHLVNMQEKHGSLDDRIRLAAKTDRKPMPELSPDHILDRIDRKESRTRKFAPIRTFAPLAAAGLVTAIALSLSQPQPSQVLFSLSGAQKSSAMVGAENSSAVAGDMRIANPFTYKYVTGPNFTGEPSRSSVYKLNPIDLEQGRSLIARLAKTFGVSGELKVTPKTDEYGFDNITIEGAGKLLSISVGATSSWYYTNQVAISSMEDGKKAAKPSDAEVTSVIGQLAKDLSLNSAEYRSDVYNLDWGTTAILTRTIDGEAVPIETSIAWDFDGKLQNAGGFLGSFSKQGEFDTVSAKQAASRIEQNWWGNLPQFYYMNPKNNVCQFVDTRMADSTESVDIAPTLEVKEILLEKAERVMLGAMDSEGSYWIVPGWNLVPSDACMGNYSIISLPDGTIKLPEAMIAY